MGSLERSGSAGVPIADNRDLSYQEPLCLTPAQIARVPDRVRSDASLSPARGAGGRAAAAQAQTEAAPTPLDPVVVTATSAPSAASTCRRPIDTIDGATIRDGQPAINLSEPLVRVPGVFAANRNNYAQDLQISSRGFGARATFGVRGVRLYQDFIPATMPDGQGQTGSFSLLSAQQHRGAARSVLDALRQRVGRRHLGVHRGSGHADPVADAALSARQLHDVQRRGEGDRHGERRSATSSPPITSRPTAIASIRRRRATSSTPSSRSRPAESTRVTVIGSSQHQPDSQDPLGLTQAQVDADPRQADPAAVLFNTRKTVNQLQGGVAVEQGLARRSRCCASPATAARGRSASTSRCRASARRRRAAWSTSTATTAASGARLICAGALAGRPLTLFRRRGRRPAERAAAGLRQQQRQPGRAAPRRGRHGRAARDAYAEVEWHALPALSLTLGVRSSRVHYDSDDHYIVGRRIRTTAARAPTPTRARSPASVWHAADTLNVYVSYGQGFETPTFAELAYRPVGPGLNLALDPATSTSVEIGAEVAAVAATARQSRGLRRATRTRKSSSTPPPAGAPRTATRARRARRGFEAVWDADLRRRLHRARELFVAARPTFDDAFVTGLPPIAGAGGRAAARACRRSRRTAC